MLEKKGFLLAVSTAILWGILPTFLRMGLHELDPYTLTWSRFVFAFGLMFFYLWVRGQLPRLKGLSKKTWGLLIFAGIGLASNYILYLIGLQFTSPTMAQTIVQVGPIFLAMGGLWFFNEKYYRVQWAGSLLFVVGFILFFREQLSSIIGMRQEYVLGSFLVFASAFTWSIYAIAQKPLLKSFSSPQILCVMYAICFVSFAPYAKPSQLLHLSPLGLGCVIFCGINTLVAYGCFAESLNLWKASRVSAVLALSPLITFGFNSLACLLWPEITIKEVISVLTIMGAVLLVLGSMLIALGKKS